MEIRHAHTNGHFNNENIVNYLCFWVPEQESERKRFMRLCGKEKQKCLNTIELLTFSRCQCDRASERTGKHVTKVNERRGFETDEKKIFLLMVINCNDFFLYTHTHVFILWAIINLMRLQSIFSMVPMMLLLFPQKLFSLKTHSGCIQSMRGGAFCTCVCVWLSWFGHKMKNCRGFRPFDEKISKSLARAQPSPFVQFGWHINGAHR